MADITPVALHLENLRKTYPNGVAAIRDVSLAVSPGEVFGLVGPNGAGKSTLLKLAAGLLFPETGRVVCGEAEVTSRPTAAARYIGLMPDPLGVYTDLSSREYLEFFGRALAIPEAERLDRIRATVALLELEPWLDAEVETLSAGWQRRLALGRVLLAQVPILLLDEPAAGLDVAARSELLRIVRRLATTGRTLVISSHILPELQQLADRFGILNQGAWVNAGADTPFFTRTEMERGFGRNRWTLRCAQPEAARETLAAAGLPATAGGAGELAFFAASDEEAAKALRSLVEAGVPIYEFRRQQTELADVVLGILRAEPPPPPAATVKSFVKSNGDSRRD